MLKHLIVAGLLVLAPAYALYGFFSNLHTKITGIIISAGIWLGLSLLVAYGFRLLVEQHAKNGGKLKKGRRMFQD